MGSTDLKTLVLALLILLGVGFELLKHLPVGRNWLASYNVTATDDSYAVRGHRTPSPSKTAANSLRIPRPANSHTVTGPRTEIPALLPTTGKGVELPALVQVEAKDKKKKKKKKKKTEAVAQTESSAPEQKSERPNPEREEPKASGAGRSTSEVTTYASPAAPARAQEPSSAEEWLKTLREKTDKVTLNRFIQAYRERSITAGVFYKVVNELLNDKNEALQLNAVVALTATPSVPSFSVLSDISRELRTDNTVRLKAETALARYANLATLSILQTVMAASDSPYTTLMATKQLNSAITRYSTAATASPSAQSTSQYTSYFEPFVSILTGLVTSKDSTVAAQASQTLVSLQSFLQGDRSGPATDSTGSTAANNSQVSL